MITFALTKCDLLSVLVCCDDDETIRPEVRKNWIAETFKDHHKIAVETFCYNNAQLPNTSQASANVSRIWAAEFKKIYPGHSLLITSEPYGELVADFMQISHIPFDMKRTQVPVSASVIRKDLFANWKFLPDAVKRYFAIKVVISGTESTGKTTLTRRLAAHYRCSFILEAGREIITDSNNFTFNDLHLVAREHSARIAQAMIGDSPFIIIDTDVHITKSYGKFMFDKDLPVGDEIYLSNSADLYLYLNNDAPYYQDGTRLSKEDRDALDTFHRGVIKQHQINIVEIAGSWASRFDQATKHIATLLETKLKI